MLLTEFDTNMRAIFGASEPWDRDGIQIDCGSDVKKALVSLDCTGGALKRAQQINAGLIVTHHPLIFRQLSSVSAADSVGGRVISACRAGISVVSYHTCLDIAPGGVNDCLCRAIGLADVRSFLPFGRIGVFQGSGSFEEFAENCENALGAKAQNALDCGRKVKVVAVVSGAGKDEIADAVRAGADTYVTGEVSHAAMIDCREYGINLLCLTHYATENVVLPFLAHKTSLFVPEVELYGV